MAWLRSAVCSRIMVRHRRLVRIRIYNRQAYSACDDFRIGKRVLDLGDGHKKYLNPMKGTVMARVRVKVRVRVRIR